MKDRTWRCLIVCALAAVVSFSAAAQARECSLERRFEEAVATMPGFVDVPRETRAAAESVMRIGLPGLRKLWWRPSTSSILALAAVPMLLPVTFFSERQLANDYVLQRRQAINQSARAKRREGLPNRVEGEFLLRPVLYRFTERDTSYQPTSLLIRAGMDYFASDNCLYSVLLGEGLTDEDAAGLDLTFKSVAMTDAREHPRSFSSIGLPLGPHGRPNAIGLTFWQLAFALLIAPAAWRFGRGANIERSRQITFAQSLLVALTGGSLMSGGIDALELAVLAVVPLTLLGLALLHNARFAVPAAIVAFSITISSATVLICYMAVSLVSISPLFALFSFSANLQVALALYMGWQIFGTSHTQVAAAI